MLLSAEARLIPKNQVLNLFHERNWPPPEENDFHGNFLREKFFRLDDQGEVENKAARYLRLHGKFHGYGATLQLVERARTSNPPTGTDRHPLEAPVPEIPRIPPEILKDLPAGIMETLQAAEDSDCDEVETMRGFLLEKEERVNIGKMFSLPYAELEFLRPIPKQNKGTPDMLEADKFAYSLEWQLFGIYRMILTTQDIHSNANPNSRNKKLFAEGSAKLGTWTRTDVKEKHHHHYMMVMIQDALFRLHLWRMSHQRANIQLENEKERQVLSDAASQKHPPIFRQQPPKVSTDGKSQDGSGKTPASSQTTTSTTSQQFFPASPGGKPGNTGNPPKKPASAKSKVDSTTSTPASGKKDKGKEKAKSPSSTKSPGDKKGKKADKTEDSA